MFDRGVVKLDRGLYTKAVHCAAELGYASVDELVTHLLERELNRPPQEDEAEDALKRLKGLGYID